METPYFLIHTEKMDALVDDLLCSVQQYWKDAIVGYSFKTNNLPWIIEHMKQKSLYAEVVSSDEFQLAKELKFPYEKIIFNGPVKGKREMLEALEHGSIVNLDAKRELYWLCECSDIKGKIGLRVNFDLESMCPGETQCGIEDGRFGFSYEKGEFSHALQVLQEQKIPVSGLHLHCSSKTRSVNIYQVIAKMAAKLVREFHLQLEYLDIGGGFFGGVEGKPSFETYFSAIYDIISQEPALAQTNLVIEPGMCLVGAPIDYVTKVVDVKETAHNRFVLLDGSRTHIDPLMRKTGYSWAKTNRQVRASDISNKQTLCGFTCMENDRFFTLTDSEALQEQDEITFYKVGAYTMGMSPLFIQWFPAVYVKNGSQTVCVRKKWSAQKLVD